MNTQELNLAIIEARIEVQRLLSEVETLENELSRTERKIRDAYQVLEDLGEMV